jgi:hypothetical protein
MASPRVFTNVPPCAAMLSFNARNKRLTSASACVSPSDS